MPSVSFRTLRRCDSACKFFARASAFCALVLGAAPALADPSELSPEVSYNYQEIETPRITATGGAERALSNSLSALFINPANMAASRVYHIGAFAQIWPEARRQSYGIAAVDSIVSSSRLAGGLGATYNLMDPDGIDRTWLDVRGGLAFPFSDSFFLGATVRYLKLGQDGLGPLGRSPASGGLEGDFILDTFSFDVGATLKPTKEFAISVVGNNLSNPDNGFQPLTVGGGIGYGNERFSLEADVVGDFTTYDDTTMRAMAGLEILVGDNFPLRAGYRFDEGAESHALGFGAGYIDRALSAEIGIRRTVSGEAATAVVFGFTYHLESAGLAPGGADTF